MPGPEKRLTVLLIDDDHLADLLSGLMAPAERPAEVTPRSAQLVFHGLGEV